MSEAVEKCCYHLGIAEHANPSLKLRLVVMTTLLSELNDIQKRKALQKLLDLLHTSSLWQNSGNAPSAAGEMLAANSLLT